MIGTTIMVLTTHRQTRRQIARALMSAGSTTRFAESVAELNDAIGKYRPSLVILDSDDPEAVESVLASANGEGPGPVVLLSISKDKRPLANLLERHDLSNLVAKHGAIRASYPSLDERELVVTCEKVLQRDIFGIDKYIGNWGVVLHYANITSPKDKAPFLERFEDYLNGLDCPKSVVPDIITVADELIMNAIVHAPRDEEGKPKYEDFRGASNIVLAPHEFVQVAFGSDGQRLMISVADNFGTLDKKKVHAYLSRAFGPPLVPEAKPSGAGIGLSMSFRSIHQLIFNVQESKRTEAIAGWYLDVNTGAEFRQVGKSLNLFWLPESSKPLLQHTSASALAVLYLPPKIDESTTFPDQFEAMLLDLSAVKAVSPGGLTAWGNFVKAANGRLVVIQNCPPEIVHQAATGTGMLSGVTVQTVLVPYQCTTCSTGQDVQMAPDQFASNTPRTCNACGKELSFTGKREEYDAFLRAIGAVGA
jgi:hypothetical protein